MPLTPSAIANRRATCTFTYAGERVTISYLAGRITSLSEDAAKAKQADLLRITAEDGEEAARRFLAAWVLDYLTSWDLVEDNPAEDGTPGPMLALDVDTLSSLDPDFVGALLTAMFEDIQAGKASGTTPSAS